jgi:LPXTG-motif cell wall-anchored protein
MSERTDHPPSTEASSRRNVVRRAVIGGAAGVALLVGPVALANAIVPKDDDPNADRVEAAAESETSLVNLRRQSSEVDQARAGALQSLRSTTTTTAPPTTTTTAAPTTTTTEPPLPARAAAGVPAPPPPAPAPKKELPKTGPHDRLLLLGAGAALAMGGLAVAAGARRRRAPQS